MPHRDEGKSHLAQVSRREFGQRAALAMAAIAATPIAVPAAAADFGCGCGSFAEQLSHPNVLSANARAEIDLKVQHVLQMYGDRFSEDQKKRLRRIIEYHVRMLESVLSFPLNNGDAPASVLKLITGERVQEASPAREISMQAGGAENGF